MRVRLSVRRFLLPCMIVLAQVSVPFQLRMLVRLGRLRLRRPMLIRSCLRGCRRPRRSIVVVIVFLRLRPRRDEGERERDACRGCAVHATTTSRNIPASMWYRRWQW